MTTCIAVDCTRRPKARGLCSMHYQRVRNIGSLDLSRPTLAERFWPKVDKNGPAPDYRPDLGPCWLWIASLDRKGYGQFMLTGERKNPKLVRSHRLAYELACGPIPNGLQLDHLCRVRHCCNPNHLDPVTNAENARRGDRPNRTECPQGHPYTEENTVRTVDRKGYTHRQCRTCRTLYQSNRRVSA